MDARAFRAALDAGERIVLDGGLATQLEAQGADLSDALWSARLLAEDPAAIVDAHLAYYRAGAQVATTASYQATFEGFARRGIGRVQAEQLLRRSVELAAAARARIVAEAPGGPRRFVAASIGPYGAMLADGSEYRGRYGRSVAELKDFHRDRLKVLAATDADVLAVETIPEVEEAAAVVELLGETPGATAWVSFSCADGRRIRSGAPIEEAVAAVAGSPAVVAVGINCTAPEHASELIGRIAAVTSLPVVAYPNSGEAWDAAGRSWTGNAGSAGTGVDAAAARAWLAGGARLVGGCCRVTPDQIASIAGVVAQPTDPAPADAPLPFDVEGPVKAEVYLVWLADGAIRLGGPDGPRAWELEVGAGEHPVDAVDRIVRDVVGEPLLVHSTSWRREGDAVVLSFLVVVDPALVAGQPSVVVGREDLARSSARAAPAAIATGQVLEHALRHLAWLAEDDEVVRHELSDEWRAALAGYVPEPFRSLG